MYQFGLCVTVCPSFVLEMRNEKTEVVREGGVSDVITAERYVPRRPSFTTVLQKGNLV